MTAAQIPPSLPLAEDVRWRHALAYQAPTAAEIEQAAQFAKALARRIAGAPLPTSPELPGCPRCASFSRRELDALAIQLGRRANRGRDIKQRIIGSLREQGPQSARQLGLVLLDIPLKSIRMRLNEMRKDGRVVVHRPPSKWQTTVWAVPEEETTC